ncbi:MAG: rfaE bifunctional protein kinase chain/domain [Lentimonas sp.]|jgi:rfaE bifunctional protein kinase chain/domain
MQVNQIFETFNDLKIVVIGDVMIDSYIRGSVTRISPEAPVPIISLSKKEDRLGGAANVAINLVALGVKAEIISVIGDDDSSKILKNLLVESNIKSDKLVASSTRTTTIKTRVIGNNQHLLRVDNEQTNDITAQEENQLILAAKARIDDGIDAVIFEDYNKGILTTKVIDQITNYANEKGVIIAVDPKKLNFLAYKNVTLFKPNLKELKEGLGKAFDFSDFDLFEEAVEELERLIKPQISFVTLSEHGVYVKKGKDKKLISAHLRKISDVSGAGDTVIAVATTCLAAGMEPVEMARIANLAGGLVCELSGVVAIDKMELLDEALKLKNGI